MIHEPGKSRFSKVRILGYEQISPRHQAIADMFFFSQGFLSNKNTFGPWINTYWVMKETKHQQQKHLKQKTTTEKRNDVFFPYPDATNQKRKTPQTTTAFFFVLDASITPADVFGVHGFLVQVWGWAGLMRMIKCHQTKYPWPNREVRYYRSDSYT